MQRSIPVRKKIAVSAANGNNVLTMIVKDVGKGFDTGALIKGNGLENIQTRAVSVGGKLSIDSNPGNWNISTCPSFGGRIYAAGVNGSFAGGIRKREDGNWTGLTTPFYVADCSDDLTLTTSPYGSYYREANNSITSTQNISPTTGTNVKYNAGTTIVLQPGFTAPSGTSFKTFLTGCGGEVDHN